MGSDSLTHNAKYSMDARCGAGSSTVRMLEQVRLDQGNWTRGKEKTSRKQPLRMVRINAEVGEDQFLTARIRSMVFPRGYSAFDPGSGELGSNANAC
jgi:hypothetical protein